MKVGLLEASSIHVLVLEKTVEEFVSFGMQVNSFEVVAVMGLQSPLS